jgi:hypothetical protein
VDWDALRDLEIPILEMSEQKEITDNIRRADRMRNEAEVLEEDAVTECEEKLGLRNDRAIDRLDAAGPPS